MSGQYVVQCVALWATTVLVFDLVGIEGSPSEIFVSTSAALMGLGNTLVKQKDLLSNQAISCQTQISLVKQNDLWSRLDSSRTEAGLPLIGAEVRQDSPSATRSRTSSPASSSSSSTPSRSAERHSTHDQLFLSSHGRCRLH